MKRLSRRDFNWLNTAVQPNGSHAIETRYKGYRFRSRLEARWAVFFDALKLRWEYEKEGYDLGDLGPYLPDFWLPDVNMWAEVKPLLFTNTEKAKCRALTDATGYPCLMLVALPDKTSYWATVPMDEGYDIEIDGQEYAGTMDYLLTTWHLDERRFYSSPGCTGADCADVMVFGDRYEFAVTAARAARFEHGEKG